MGKRGVKPKGNIIRATIEPCRQAMRDAGLSNSDINEVILVGGSSRIPAVQKKVEEFLGRPPSKGVNPDEVKAEANTSASAFFRSTTQ